MRKILLFSILIISFLYSCDIINPKESVPSYIQIDTQKVVVLNPVVKGNNNHGIFDAWIYIDDKYQGNYEPPVKFPVLTTGNHKITIIAGIKTNGISATREEYPFYQEYIIDTNLTEDGITKLTPTYNYIDEAYFWIEDFQDPNVKIAPQTGMNSDTSIIRVANPDVSGDYYGAIYVTTSNPKCNVATNPETDPIYAFQAYQRMFLELEYKNNQKFWVGMYADGIPYSVELLNPSADWITIYIDLTETIRAHPANIYMLFFNTEYNGDYNGEVFLNNIKLINYE
jgi:hypothetical protein